MNITVLGATGGTGMQVVQQALAAGHSVTALVRSPEKMTVTDPRLRVVQGDATDQASVAKAIEAANAVISTLDALQSKLAAGGGILTIPSPRHR